MDFDISSQKKPFNDALKNSDLNSENSTDANKVNDIWNEENPATTENSKLFSELIEENIGINIENSKNIEEFNGFKNTQQMLSDKQFIEVLKKFDTNHDGQVDANEVCSAWIDVQTLKLILGEKNGANQQIRKLFKGFLRGNGTLDSHKFLNRAGSDGKLNISELTSTAIEGNSEDYADMKVNIQDKAKNTFFDALKKFDSNNDSKIDAAELCAIWNDGNPANKEIKRLFRGFMNQDGTPNTEMLTQIAGDDGKIGVEQILRYADRAQNIF